MTPPRKIQSSWRSCLGCVPGPWATQNPHHWTCAAVACSSFVLVAGTHLAHLLHAAHKNITKCCKCHSSFRHLILTKVHSLKYPTLVNYGGLRAMGTPSTLSINSQILLKSAGLPALILTQVEQEKVADNIFLNIIETSKPQRRSQTRWWWETMACCFWMTASVKTKIITYRTIAWALMGWGTGRMGGKYAHVPNIHCMLAQRLKLKNSSRTIIRSPS